jgi:hypothetical protein
MTHNADPLDDQTKAASDAMRKRLDDFFAPAGDLPTTQHPEDDHWMVVLLDKTLADRTGTCEHLAKTPAQPMYVTPYERFFRCQRCFEQDGLAQETARRVGKMRTFGAIEEGTCDRCRTYVGDHLTATMVRLSHCAIVMGLCSTCVAKTEAEGGKLYGG